MLRFTFALTTRHRDAASSGDHLVACWWSRVHPNSGRLPWCLRYCLTPARHAPMAWQPGDATHHMDGRGRRADILSTSVARPQRLYAIYIIIYNIMDVGNIGGKIHIVFLMLFRFLHIFLNIDPFLMKFVPFESSHSQLSNGTKIIKNGSILRKIWRNRSSITNNICNCPLYYLRFA